MGCRITKGVTERCTARLHPTRALEDLPVIDDLTAYDDIIFPELYDTSTIIERITGEADLIKRQLR